MSLNKISQLLDVSKQFDDHYLIQAARRLAKRMVDVEFGYVSPPSRRPSTVLDNVQLGATRLVPYNSRDFTSEEIGRLDANDKFGAAKLVRVRLNLSLIEAKHYVEGKTYRT